MRFVSPETVRIDLADGDWIDVKKELTVGEDNRMRARGWKRISRRGDGTEGNGAEFEIDWAELAFARADAYIVDWSARTPTGKDLPVTADAIRTLCAEDFQAIDEAIQKHMVAMQDEKKGSAGASSSATP